MNTGSAFLRSAVQRMKSYKELGDKTFHQLSDSQFHVQPSSDSNSIAILIQHMSGNMLSRFTNFLTEDGEKEWRKRDDEFEPHDYSKAELLQIWENGWACFLGALELLTEPDLVKKVMIRNEPLTVIDAINRQLTHYAYHIGQIITIARILKNDEWVSLSIPKGQSKQFNRQMQSKKNDP